MNDKILKFAIDSSLVNYVDNETPKRYFVSGHADLEDVEKFAELIVKECCEQISLAKDTRWIVPPSQEQVVRNAIQNVKEHFGVD